MALHLLPHNHNLQTTIYHQGDPDAPSTVASCCPGMVRQPSWNRACCCTLQIFGHGCHDAVLATPLVWEPQVCRNTRLHRRPIMQEYGTFDPLKLASLPYTLHHHGGTRLWPVLTDQWGMGPRPRQLSQSLCRALAIPNIHIHTSPVTVSAPVQRQSFAKE